MIRLLTIFLRHVLAPLAILFCVALPCKTTTAQQPEMDFAKLFNGIELRPTDSAFIAPPREVIRPLLRCKKLMAEGQIGEAVEILGEVLSDDTVEDYLISRGSRSFSSLRMRTESILGSIDRKYLEPYQIRYDIRARKLLQRGVAENDLDLLKKVSNRFFFTDSGSEAAMLLGQMELSNGQPSAAQSWFAKIVRFSSTAAKHDPEASILLATCQLLGNNRNSAKETLVSLKHRMPDSAIEVMGKNYTLFSRSDDAIPWLTKLIGSSPLASSKGMNKLLMFQGNPSRTGKTGSGIPLLAARWEHQTADSTSLQKSSRTYVEKLVQEHIPPAPAVQPLVVGDTIVFRTAGRMFGVDADSGLRKWAWPPQLAWNSKNNLNSGNTKTAEVRLQQRMVKDAIYGRASSDGKLIFFVPSPGSKSSRSNRNAFQSPNFSEPEDVRTCNELVAIDAESSGMLRWRVGGPNGFDEPRLADAFFMGEPLPLEGVLYCCCLLDNAVQLVALDGNTGKLRWSQAIAAHDNDSFQRISSRRFAGVTPSYADGKLVCLTGTGGVVAIEVSTRSLLWGYEYRLPKNTQIISDDKKNANELTDVWRDSQVTIANGKVFLTPVLSRELICLSLDDGYGVWYEEDGFMPTRVNRDDSLHLAGINRDQLILVGLRTVRSIDSFTGNQVWKIDLGIDDLPSGRGYIGEDSLFVPTASRKVLRIDLVKGEIVESVGTSRVLGNLSRVKNDVVSYGVDHVASFPEYESSKKQIEGMRPVDLDEDQKFILLQTMIQQGEFEEGVDLLISLAEENARPRYSELLKSCVNNFRTDLPSLSLRALDGVKRLYPNDDIEELEQLRMLSVLRSGEFRESVQLGVEQLEKQFAKFCNGEIEDTSGKIAKGVSAKLLDRRSAVPAEPSGIEGVDDVEFDNRYDRLLYSEFGWQRTRLQLAFEGLKEQDADALGEFRTRMAKLVTESSTLPHEKFQWLLDRLPENVFDVSTLEFVSRHFLRKEKHLAALLYANMGIDRGEDNVERFRLLKSKIFLDGGDVRAALAELGGVNSDQLDNDGIALLENLKEQVLETSEAAASNLRSAANWFSNDSEGIDFSSVAIRSVKKDPVKTTYRIPFKFSSSTDLIYHSLQLYARPWDRKVEFELRNRRGNLVRSLKIRDKNDTKAFGDSRRYYIDVQNHAVELRVSKDTFYVDWFKILAGEDGNLWKLPISGMAALRTAFSGRRETVVGSGDWLYCYETLSGKLVWKRKMQHRLTRVVAHGFRLTSWSEKARQFNTLEAATGRLIRTASTKRYVVSRTFGSHFVLEYPIRKGELPAEQEKALTGPNGPANAAQIAKQLAVFDAAKGQLLWETVFHPKSAKFYRNLEVALLKPDGNLRFVDLKNGDVTAEVNLPLTASELQASKSFNLRHHSAGWIVHVKSNSRGGYFKRGKATYRYSSLHRGLGSGSVHLLDSARKNLVWDSPVHLEQMEYLEEQPFDSPVVMFGRHIQRTIPIKGESHHTQTVCLNRATGDIISNNIQKTRESYDGHAIAWEQSNPGGPFDTLVIETTVEVQRVKFGIDSERPPFPDTHVTFNAMDFFNDPIFKKVKNKVIDLRVEEFRQRASDAENVRAEKQAKAAVELMKRMNVESSSESN